MKDLTKKVVILKNLSSPYVHQAIIVLRDYNPKLETKAVLEAERIVNAYLDNVKINSGRIRTGHVRKTKSLLLYAVTAFFSSFLTAAVLIRFNVF